jgi:hypothetical protein
MVCLWGLLDILGSSNTLDSLDCNGVVLVDRQPRPGVEPMINYGEVASGNQVVKNATVTGSVSGEFGECCASRWRRQPDEQLPISCNPGHLRLYRLAQNQEVAGIGSRHSSGVHEGGAVSDPGSRGSKGPHGG